MTYQKTTGLRILSWLLVIILLVGIFGLQMASDQSKRDKKLSSVERNRLIEPIVFSAKFIKTVDLGFHQTVADFLWLQTIQYFGGGDFSKKYYALGPILETITDLDPKFRQPYIFAMLILPWQKDVDIAIKLGEKGLRENPGFGMIPYYLASIYHQEKKDYRRAADLYALAAKDSTVPKAAKILAGVSLSQLDDRQAAILWWQGIVQSAKKDSYEQKRAQIWLNHLVIELQLEQIVASYKQKTGHNPASLDQLVREKIIDQIPASPLGGQYVLDTERGKINIKF